MEHENPEFSYLFDDVVNRSCLSGREIVRRTGFAVSEATISLMRNKGHIPKQRTLEVIARALPDDGFDRLFEIAGYKRAGAGSTASSGSRVESLLEECIAVLRQVASAVEDLKGETALLVRGYVQPQPSGSIVKPGKNEYRPPQWGKWLLLLNDEEQTDKSTRFLSDGELLKMTEQDTSIGVPSDYPTAEDMVMRSFSDKILPGGV